MRDIPTYDGKENAMPHTHLIEFEDFLVNTGSEINELPQFDEPQPVDIAQYQGVIKDVEVFSCCVPSHLYLYLKGVTSIKEAMENIKRACALGGVQQ